jgi:hypothetical protein
MKKDRAAPRRGGKPPIGSLLVREDLRLTVQAGLSDDLWQWLMENGWRELTYRPDRRHYRELPASWVTRLIDAQPENRMSVLNSAIAKAASRPALGNEGTVPSYVTRE